jgi:hypothetical protein
MRQLELWFGRLQATFLERRSSLLAAQLDHRLLGGMLGELRRNAGLVESPLFLDLVRRVERLSHAASPDGNGTGPITVPDLPS